MSDDLIQASLVVVASPTNVSWWVNGGVSCLVCHRMNQYIGSG